MVFILLCVLYCIAKTSEAEHHTLQYLYTLRSTPEDVPEFEITTVFDDLIISHCETPSFRDQSRQEWIHQAFTAEEWKNRDLFCEGEYYFHKPLKEKIQQTINTTSGIIQRERSCTADDSVVSMSDRWGVNGEDFLTLDLKTLKWRSKSSLARTVQSEFNQMKFMTPSLKDFQLNHCKPSLMKLKRKKADYLKQTLRAAVNVFAKSSADRDSVYLRCSVSHKYLPEVRVQLTLDGEVVGNNVNISSPAPNMDSSVQIRLQTETSIKEPDRYHCTVDTYNLHISVGWDGQTLDRKTLDQNHVSDVFGLHFTNIWIAFILVMIIAGIAVVVAVAVKGGTIVCNRGYIPRNININQKLQLIHYVPTQEDFEKEVKDDDELYGPTSGRYRNPQDNEAVQPIM